MKRIILVLILVSLFLPSNLIASCDKAGAIELQNSIGSFGSWSIEQGKVIFRWGKDWDQMSKSQRLGLIQGFANADACINGKSRSIIFLRNEKKVGEASPSTGIRLVD